MPLHEIRTNDIDELFSWAEDWDGRYWQLAARPLGYRSVRVTFSGVEILWQRFARPVLYEEALVQDRLVFSVLLRASSPGRYRGHDIGPGAIARQPQGTEGRSVGPRTCEVLEISLSPSLGATIAPVEGPTGLRRVDPRALMRLVRVCREVTLRTEFGEAGSLGPRSDADCVLLALRDVLVRMPGSGPKPPGTRPNEAEPDSVVSGACEIMDHRSASGALRTADLAAELDISERSLYAAFQRRLGIGPHALHLVRRMHVVRDALLTGSYYPGKAAQAGRAAGFADASSLTRSYRRCFGESPRDTLRRRGRL